MFLNILFMNVYILFKIFLNFNFGTVLFFLMFIKMNFKNIFIYKFFSNLFFFTIIQEIFIIVQYIWNCL